MNPRILVIGAGSIGRRHALNLTALGARVTVMDVDQARAASIEGVAYAPYDPLAAAAHDAVVIASPSSLHGEHLAMAAPLVGHVLVEKPMVASVDELRLIDGLDGRVMVGYNLRHHAPIAELHRRYVAGDFGRAISARLWFGSWLPDWRPQVDYRTTYSARRSLGGGVLVDAIHELDLAVWFFGPELAVAGAIVSTRSDLDIDVEDTVLAALATPDGLPIAVTLDYVSRVYRRGIEIVGDEATARLDWASHTLTVERPTGVEVVDQPASLDDSYRLEAQCFLDWIDNRGTPSVDGHAGAVSVRLADSIRAAAAG